jgi:putative ABC transport system permease protein
MLRVTLSGLWSRKRRLAGMAAAVILGVTFLTGTLVLTDSVRSGFTAMFQEANAGTDAVVRGDTALRTESFEQRRPVDLAVLEDVRAVDGVATAEPSIEGLGQIVAADGDPIGGNGPPTVATNWIDDTELNPWQIAEGRAPEASGEVVIDRRAAEDGGLAVGDDAVVLTPAPVEVQIVGVATFGDEDSLGATTYAAFTFGEAQRLLLGDEGVVSEIAVRAEPGISQADLVARLAPALGPDLQAITGEQLTEEQVDLLGSDFLDLFEMFLLVFTGVALVVAGFSIYNTFSVVSAQRTRESALLRAVGASRGQVLRSTLVEATTIGTVASALGIAAGTAVAAGLIAFLSSSGFGASSGEVVVTPGRLVWAFVIGTAITVLAAIAPAVHAARVPPLAALRDVAVDRSSASILRTVAGVIITVGGGFMVATAATADDALAQAGLGALLTMVGMVVVGPIVARPVGALLGAPLARFRGITGELARNNATRNPKRTAGTASALMVGVGVVTLFTIFGASVTKSMADTVDQRFGGDLVVGSNSWSGAGITPELAGILSDLPEVEVASGIGEAAIAIDGADRELLVIDPATLGAVLDLGVVDGSLDDLGPDELAVSEDRATDEGWAVGDPVPAAFGDGTSATLTVGAIYEGRDLLGDLLVSRDLWTPHATQELDDVVLVLLADGVALADGRAAVAPIAEQYGAPLVQDRDEYIDSIAAEVDQFLTVVYVLLAISVVIALMGIANTLSLSIHERTRELGLLRAVGQTRRQVRRMVRSESIVIALFGTLGGIGLGLFLAWGLVRAMAESEGMGSFTAPPGPLLVVVAVGAAVGIVAAVRPARRAARTDVLAAIAAE